MIRKAVTTLLTSLAVGLAVALCAPSTSFAQGFSLAPGAGLPPPPVLPGPCGGLPFAPDGDIYDTAAGVTIPMGPPGCGLGWPAAPGNVDAFSTGMSPAIGLLPLPFAPGTISLMFSVDPTAIGDQYGLCVPLLFGPFVAADVPSEACLLPGSTDAPADVFISAANAAPWGGGAPAPATSPHFQAFDGDGAPSACPLPIGPPLGPAEPFPPSFDDLDGWDPVPVPVYDAAPPDSTPDIPVYYSVDAITAALLPGSGADVFVTAGGAFGPYAFAAALGLGAADDIDALEVLDVGFDGIYAPGAGDTILYSLAPGSPGIGAIDCFGFVIEEGDILTEGTPFLCPGIPAIVVFEEDVGLWSAPRLCGPNPITGVGGDNVNAIALVGPPALPPTTTTTTTTTSTTTTTAGATTTTTAGATTTTTAGATTTTTAGATTTTTAGATTTTTTTSTSTTTTLPPPLCGGAPLGGCKSALSGKSKFQIKLKVDPAKNQLKFKYNKGTASVLTEFGDPVGGSPQYSLCVWDGSVSPQPLLELQIGPGGTCGTKPCWKTKTGKSHQYKNKGGNADGVEQVKIKADGAPDKAQVQVKAKGLSFTPPALPLTTTVTAQFIVDDGGISCWEVPMSTTIKNDTVQFKAKGD